MRLPLAEFEDHIDTAIVKRGRSYFKEGRVEQCEEIEPGIFAATVAGSEDYGVRVLIKGGIVAQYDCDCPYDLGPACKHLVAVMFHLRAGGSPPTVAKRDKKATSGKAKRKTAEERVDHFLDTVPHDDLKQFVRDLTGRDRDFREIFLSAFAHLAQGESRSAYAAQIKAALRSAAGRNGFVDWRAAARVGLEVSRLLDSARRHLDAGNHLASIDICTAVMEQMTRALQYADDSNGDIGENIRSADKMLQGIAAANPPEHVRRQLLEYALAAFDKKLYEGWDGHFGMLDLASELITSANEIDLILDRLKTTALSEYEIERAEVMTYKLILKLKGKPAADDYLKGHISNPQLRRAAIQSAYNAQQFDTVRRLAKEGIEQDRLRKMQGLVVEWHESLLKSAQAEGKTDEVLMYSQWLFLNSLQRHQDYYAVMQGCVPAEAWGELRERMIRDLIERRGLEDPEVAAVYVREGMHDRLMDLVKRSPSFHKFDAYEKYLKKDYASHLAELYAAEVRAYLDNSYNVGRGHYQTACRYIRRMKKLGSSAQAALLVAELRERYPRRKALLEELETI